ncbi:MAG: hypothetical protein OXF08_10400 [Bacteroidetes bacterium]|nr:hypothetical protein [Bacteroidota bacterium]
MINRLIELFESENDDLDLQEDLSSWFNLYHKAHHQFNDTSLAQFLQELDLRSKVPSPQSHSVCLTTIHGVKGQEFDIVYLIGLVDEILPSWHSIHKNNAGKALEEERRACFVAITRTKNDSFYHAPKNTRIAKNPLQNFLWKWVWMSLKCLLTITTLPLHEF